MVTRFFFHWLHSLCTHWQPFQMPHRVQGVVERSSERNETAEEGKYSATICRNAHYTQVQISTHSHFLLCCIVEGNNHVIGSVCPSHFNASWNTQRHDITKCLNWIRIHCYKSTMVCGIPYLFNGATHISPQRDLCGCKYKMLILYLQLQKALSRSKQVASLNKYFVKKQATT